MENTYIFESQEEMAEYNTIQGPATAETYFSHPPLLASDIYTEMPETFLYPDSSLLPQILSNSVSTHSNSLRETQANSSEQELAHLLRIVESGRLRLNTTQTDRVKIMAALSLGHSISEIVRIFGYLRSQIYNVQKNGTELRQNNCGRKPAIFSRKIRGVEKLAPQRPKKSVRAIRVDSKTSTGIGSWPSWGKSYSEGFQVSGIWAQDIKEKGILRYT